MKKLFLLWAGALAVLQAAMAMNVNGRYYCEPGQTAFTGPDLSNTYISPSAAVVYSGFDPVEVVAKPALGWAVDSWYVSETYSSSFAGAVRIDGADGALSVYRPFRAGDGGRNIVEYLGVKFRWLTYNLAYDSNGGSSAQGKTGLFYTNKFALAAAPVRAGYAFAGWKDSANQVFAANEEVTGSDFSELDAVHQDGHQVKLTAQWNEKSYAVGAAGENCTVTVASSARFTEALQISWQPDQANFTRPTVVVHAGADATGAVLATYSSGTSATFTMSSSGAHYDQIFITVRYEVYTLTFDPNGGKCTEASRRIEYDAYLGDPLLPTPAQYMKVFDGWHLDNGDRVGSETKYAWHKDVTVTAAWKDAETHRIETEVVPEGAGTVSGGREYLPGETAQLKVETVADGYGFSHWTNVLTQTGWPTPSLEVTVDGNAKYTAVFTGNVYTVKFDCDEELAETADVTCPKSVKLRYGEPFGELPAATVGNADYSFAYWMDVDDREIRPDTPFLMSDKINYVYAKVVLRPAYTIRYDGNGATSGSMPDQKAYCGEDTVLKPNAYVWPAHQFLNWTNASGTVYADGATVKDLVAEGETAVLYAVWKEMTLAEAMHCDNLDWTSEKVELDPDPEGSAHWVVRFGENVGSNSISCARQDASAPSSYPQALTAKLDSEGTLAFWWKPTGGEGQLWIWCNNQRSPDWPGNYEVISGADGVWSSYTLAVPLGAQYVHIMNCDLDASADIDRMTWTPKGTHPEPKEGEDNVDISTAMITDGKFTLSFEFDEEFDYLLKTNANLLIDSWGVMEVEGKKKDKIMTFEPQIIEGQPQMFYRVDTIQRK